jgi:hypothetical protein
VTIDDTIEELGLAWTWAVFNGCLDWLCEDCEANWLEVEAHALGLDMAIAQASRERTRGSVAWG